MATAPRFVPFWANSGFDQLATPRWQMLRAGGQSFTTMFLDGAVGLVVKSRNPPIADITEAPNLANVPRREFRITGQSPGTTFIDVFARNSATAVIAMLEVCVKEELPVKIAFNWLDGTLDTSARPQSWTAYMNELDSIFLVQANVQFIPTRTNKISVSTTLDIIMAERKQSVGRRVPAHREEDLLTRAGDPQAFNVYFMPWTGMEEKRPTGFLDVSDGWILPDSMTEDEVIIALPHLLGRLLGCSVTDRDADVGHLMHASRAEGRNLSPTPTVFVPSRSFIPKSCSNILNAGP